MVLAGIRCYRLQLVLQLARRGSLGIRPLCAELGSRYRQEDWHYVTSGIREGLRGWGRRVRRNEHGGDEYLASLICEGGLPLRAIHGGRWLYQWLQSTLLHGSA